MCNETGCRVIDGTGQPNATMDPLEDEAQLQLGEFHESRIDNIHGLVKLFEESNKTINPFKGYDGEGNEISNIEINDQGIITKGKEDLILLLNRLREAGRNCDDYDTLVLTIQKLLNTDQALGVDFIYDQYYENYNGESNTIEDFQEEPLSNYQERYKGKDENLSGIINEDNTDKEIHQPRNAVISMIITLENGKKLVRIPLAKLTSPLTLLGQEEFKEIKALYDKVGGNQTDFKQEVKLALLNKEDIPHLREFAMLLDIYQGTAFNNIAYLNDLFKGTLAGYAKPTGITITNKPKGEEYLQNEHYYYNGRWVALSKYKKLMPWRNVSQIMVCVDKEPITVNGKSIFPGKPFVLMSDAPELNGVDSKTLLDYYINQIKDSSVKPLVKLVEVIPPSVETERYLFNLNTALNIHKDKNKEIDKDLGTKNTSFRLLSQALLKENSPFVTEYLQFLKDNIKDEVKKIGDQEINLYKKATAEFQALQRLLKALVDYEEKHDTHSLYNLLNTPVSSLNREDVKSIKELLKYNVEGESKPRFLLPTTSDKLTLRHLFQRKLNEMVFGTLLGTSEKVVKKEGDNIKYLKPEVEHRVQTFIDSITWKEVQLHTRIKKDSNFDPISVDDRTNLNVALVETNYGSDYAVGKDGGEYQINGKADSTQYSLNIVPMLEWILRGALGRDPDVLNTKMTGEGSEPIFATTDEAKRIKGYNNMHYYEELPSERESEEEKRVKKQLEEDSKKLRKITPRDFARKGLGNKDNFIEKFKKLDEETRKKVLDDPREFIYQNLGVLAFKQKDGNYKFFMSTKGAENVKFNSDGTTSFTKSGQEYILDSERGAIINTNTLLQTIINKMNSATTHAENDAAATEASRAGIPESEWMSIYNRNEVRIENLSKESKTKYKVGDTIHGFNGYNNIIIKEIIQNPDGSIQYLTDADEYKDIRITAEKLDSYVPNNNSINNDAIVDFFSSMNTISAGMSRKYGMVFPFDDTTNADVVAITLMFDEVKLPFCAQAKEDPTISIKGTNKTFAEYLNILNSTPEGIFLLKAVQLEMERYLKARQEAIKQNEERKKAGKEEIDEFNYGNCNTLPF